MRVAVFATSRSDFDVARLLVDAIEDIELHQTYFYINPTLQSVFLNTKAIELDALLCDGSPKEYRTLISAVQKKVSDHPIDAAVLIGDRWETLLIAQILLAFNVRIIHHSGGDLTSGSLDNSYRYACSMLASVHWVSAELHGQRLINLGIPKDQIYFVGEPQLETKLEAARQTFPKSLESSYHFDFSVPYILVCLHPSIDLVDHIDYALNEVKKFLNSQPFNVLFTAPNHDRGAMEIVNFCNQLVIDHPEWRFIESLGSAFATVLARSVCLVGNSSAGMFEAPVLGVPVINLGTRQDGRLRGSNVVDCPYDAEALLKAFEQVESMPRDSIDSPYLNPKWRDAIRASLAYLEAQDQIHHVGIAL